MVKVVEQWSGNHKVVGSTPSHLVENFFLYFIYIFIEFNIHKVSLAMVEACLKNSLLQYRSVQRDSMMQCHPRI